MDKDKNIIWQRGRDYKPNQGICYQMRNVPVHSGDKSSNYDILSLNLHIFRA